MYGSLDSVVEDGKNGVLVRTPLDAAQRLKELIDEPSRASGIRLLAKKRARETFVTWEERVTLEIQLISEAVSPKESVSE